MGDGYNRSLRFLDMVMSCPVEEEVTTGQILLALKRLGYSVSKRTVERDMQTVKDRFFIIQSGSADKGYKWTRIRRLEEIATKVVQPKKQRGID